VPVTAFCEWEGETGSRRKVWFEMNDGEPFAFAGIWRPTSDGDRMAFLTCEPNATVAAVHPKAMPVVLAPDKYGQWLGDPYAGACTLAVPHPEGRLVRVNNIRATGQVGGRCCQANAKGLRLGCGRGETPLAFGVCLTASRVPHETCFVQTPPLPARCDPPCGVALVPLHSEPA
jgi:hypothetical protein